MGASPAPTKNVSFGRALDMIKSGNLVARSGWNGKGMFIFMRPEDTLSEEFVINTVKSLPGGLKSYYKKKQAILAMSNKTPVVKFTAYLCMKAADGTIVNGWLASQTDMLAEDWELVEV